MRIALVGLIMLSVVSSARADKIPDRIDDMADRIARYLKVRNATTTVIRFTGPTTLQGNGLAGLEQLLAERLANRGIQTTAQANLGIKGQLKRVKNQAAFSLTVQVVDSDDEPQVDFDFGIRFSGEDLGRVGGIPFDISGVKDDLDRWERLSDHAGRPTNSTAGTLIQAKAGSPFGIEVLVNDTARRPTDKAKLAFVPLDVEEEYTIRLHNRSDHEVAVELFIDGLSAFHFSELRKPDDKDRPRYNYFVVAANGTAEVKGWFITGQKAKAFRVTPAEDSLAAKLGRIENVGIITADFHNSWTQGEKPPSDEPGRSEGVTKFQIVQEKIIDKAGRAFILQQKVYVLSTSATVGTKFGTDTVTNLEGVTRIIGVTQASVTARYERPQK